MTARYSKKMHQEQHHKDCKKCLPNLGGCSTCTAEVTGNTELTEQSLNREEKGKKRSLASALNDHIQHTIAF